MTGTPSCLAATDAQDKGPDSEQAQKLKKPPRGRQRHYHQLAAECQENRLLLEENRPHRTSRRLHGKIQVGENFKKRITGFRRLLPRSQVPIRLKDNITRLHAADLVTYSIDAFRFRLCRASAQGFGRRITTILESRKMSWTDERVEKLTKLWAEGLSASQVAAQLGGVTRNAVIGKVHRLGLPGRAKSGGGGAARPKRPTTPRALSNFNARPAAPRQPSRGATALAVSEESVAEVYQEPQPDPGVVVPISRKLVLTELTERTCKWPIGDPMHEDFHFCGNDSGDNAPYCKYHARLAFQPSGERRRAR